MYMCIYVYIHTFFQGEGLQISLNCRKSTRSHVYHLSRCSRNVATLNDFLFGQRGEARTQRGKTSLTQWEKLLPLIFFYQSSMNPVQTISGLRLCVSLREITKEQTGTRPGRARMTCSTFTSALQFWPLPSGPHLLLPDPSPCYRH